MMEPASRPAYASDKSGSESGSILCEPSCQPFVQNLNSIAMGWVLYQEAIAMFLENPVFGVGAARFGERSCTGPTGFPHSMILQGLAELGLVGGGLQIKLLTLATILLLRPILATKKRVGLVGGRFRSRVVFSFSFGRPGLRQLLYVDGDMADVGSCHSHGCQS